MCIRDRIWLTIERVMFLRKVNPSDYPTKDEYDAALTNNLTTLYIIYSNAPYVGLLGTVIGIMITFYDMGQSGNINASDIMTGLSLALKATALGLSLIHISLKRKISVHFQRAEIMHRVLMTEQNVLII